MMIIFLKLGNASNKDNLLLCKQHRLVQLPIIEEENSGIPHMRDEGPNWRKQKSANQISVIQNLERKREISKKVNISRDLILILTKNKNARNMQIFQIVTHHRLI